jgi:hypothetical protein
MYTWMGDQGYYLYAIFMLWKGHALFFPERGIETQSTQAKLSLSREARGMW